jgi:hypothetical protein
MASIVNDDSVDTLGVTIIAIPRTPYLPFRISVGTSIVLPVFMFFQNRAKERNGVSLSDWSIKF